MASDPPPPAETADELFDDAPCGYLTTLADGAVVRVNRTFLAMTGHDRDALLAGRRFQELLTVPGRVFHDTHVGPLLRLQGRVREVAFDLLRPGREPLPALVNAVRRAGVGGGPDVVRWTVFDATDRRQYERELLLARRAAERATETERAARESAERAGRAKDEFLAVVSHELRTPLNAILGWAQLLRRQAGGNADLAEGLSVIERNTHVQVRLVDDLLDMGRVLSGKMRLDVQRVELARVVEAAMETARPAAEAKGVRLRQVLDPTVAVSGDPARLQQVFWNLFSNAVKFTPRGGHVRAVMARVNSHVEVAVADSGQGMSPAFLAHAFERFSQSDAASTRRTGGLGIGLSLVRHLAEMHGGSVEARSDGEGKGSTFVVHLPVAAVEPPSAGGDRAYPRPAVTDAPAGFPDVSLAGLRVLVVDDQHDAREVVRRVLRGAGAEVATAGSADEALDRIGAFRPDVLVSDVGMPGADGYELVRRVRMLGDGLGRVPAVALTAFSRLEDRTRAMLAGFQSHVPKPVDAGELVVTVGSLAGRVSPPTPPAAGG